MTFWQTIRQRTENLMRLGNLAKNTKLTKLTKLLNLTTIGKADPLLRGTGKAETVELVTAVGRAVTTVRDTTAFRN